MIPKYERMSSRSVGSNLQARIRGIITAYVSGQIAYNTAYNELINLGLSNNEATEILDPLTPISEDDNGGDEVLPAPDDSDSSEELLPPAPEESEDDLIVEDDAPVLQYVGIGLVAMAALFYFFVLDGEPNGY